MKYLDFFRGSSDERIAQRYIEALRQAGETRRLEYEAQGRIIIAYDENGRRAQTSFIGNLAREIRSAAPDARDAIYHRYARSSLALGNTEGDEASTYELVRPRLRILLKDSSYPDFLALANHLDRPDVKQSPLVLEHWSGFKEVLEKDLRNRGQGIFVAALTVGEELNVDLHHSMAVWSKGVDTILPVVDRVYFYEDDLQATRVAAWTDVARVMSTATLRERGLPERYRVGSFPNAEQLMAMGARVV